MKKPLTLLLLVISLHSYGQYKQARFDHLTVENGLPTPFMQTVYQDKLGYIWICTDYGIVRYDGYGTRVYRLGTAAATKFFVVLNMIEDSKGNLWVVTVDGLFNYDRSHDKFIEHQFLLKYHPIPPVSSLFAVAEDKIHNLWIWNWDARDNAFFLIRYEPQTKKLATYSIKDKGAGFINAVYFDDFIETKDGRLWLATSNGLYFYDGLSKSFKGGYLSSSDSTKRYGLYGLYQAPSEPGILWAGFYTRKENHNSLLRFDTRSKTYKKYFHDPKQANSLGEGDVDRIYEDKKHRLWIRTSKGMSLFDRQTERFTNFSLKGSGKLKFHDYYNNLIEERPDGKLWLSWREGLLLFDPENGSFHAYSSDIKDPETLNSNIVVTAFTDKTGLLWLATANGVDKLNAVRSQFVRYKSTYGLKNDNPGINRQGIAEASDGVIWMGSGSRHLIKWDTTKNTFAGIKLPKMAKGGAVVRTIDASGLIWCTKSDDGKLFTYDPKTGITDTFRNKKAWPPSLVKSHIGPVSQDNSGLIWIGTERAGIYSLDKKTGKIRSYPYETYGFNLTERSNKLNGPTVSCIYEDREGTLWVGTQNGGLNRFDRKTGTFQSNYSRDSKVKWVRQMYEDKRGRFWLTTDFDGLFLFDRTTGKSRQFTDKDGLLTNTVLGEIREDNSGKIWILSAKGFSMLNPKTWKFTNYTTANSLPAPMDLNFFDFFRTSTGRFICGCRDGFFTFYPEQLKLNSFPPQVHIETLAFSDPGTSKNNAGSVVTLEQKLIELPHNQNRITFNYVALHYQNPALNQYAYQLEGYDKNWIKAGTVRNVTYTNLSPGTYTFRVTASNSDGVWNNKGASFIVIIDPPWWFAWWAWLLYIMVFAGAIYGYIDFHSRKLRRENQVLEGKIQLRTSQLSEANHDLHEQQEEIISQRDELSKTVDNLKTTQRQLIQSEKMASLGELTAGIAHEIQNPLNFVNNFSEVNKEMLEELAEELKNGNIDEALGITADIIQNEEKINHHGKRADFIVKGMLEHSRTTTGEKQLTNINVLAHEFFKLSYQGLRAKDKNFNAELVTRFDEQLPKVEIVQQDFGRVLLNLYNNAFYAVRDKKKKLGDGFEPTVIVSTDKFDDKIVLKVRDNGDGIPEKILDKIYQPFFTTKPTGQGTGLGLSLSYDIIKAHGGELKVETGEGEFAEFSILLPLIIKA